MPWSKYTGRSCGRCIQWIYHYCGVMIAEDVKFGDPSGWIYLRDTPFAKVEWSLDDIPHFTFAEEYDWCKVVQDQKKQQVIEEEKERRKWR